MAMKGDKNMSARDIVKKDPADFTPTLGNYTDLQPFRFWCQKVLPLVYDNSLSYYELLCKVVDYLNKTMEDVGVLEGDVTGLHEAYKKLQGYVNDYFSSLDVQEEINNKLNQMASDGSLSELIKPLILNTLPPLVVDSVTDMTDINKTYILKSNSHIYQYNTNAGWYDTGIIYGETIGNVVTYLRSASVNINIDDIKPQSVYIISDIETNGIPEKNTGFIYTYGESEQSRQQFYVVFYSGATYYRKRNVNKEWSNWIFASTTYNSILSSGSDLNNLPIQSIYLVTENAASNTPVSDSGFVYTIGEYGGSTEQLYIRYSDGRTWYRPRNINGEWGSWISNDVRYEEILAQGADLNNVIEQSIYLCVEPLDYVNIPTNNSGLLYTIGSTTNAMQLYIELYTGKTHFRRRNYLGDWDNWIKNTSLNDGNNYANMYSIGNSILTGSVWLNGEYNHLSAYGNAPYSVVANAISIPKENVTHKLVSGTGLIYNNGEGSFLDNIKKVDLKSYDVLLTHFYTQDMNVEFNIGNIDSASGDGTLAGAVIELLNYIKTSNSMCQLILASVVPVSTTIYGDNVFTGTYPNGSSIKELDVLMKELANKYHFIYIDWQDLNISYNYHDYTDGLNVHANNENTYRIMGAYLGGKASSKINF